VARQVAPGAHPSRRKFDIQAVSRAGAVPHVETIGARFRTYRRPEATKVTLDPHHSPSSKAPGQSQRPMEAPSGIAPER